MTISRLRLVMPLARLWQDEEEVASRLQAVKQGMWAVGGQDGRHLAGMDDFLTQLKRSSAMTLQARAGDTLDPSWSGRVAAKPYQLHRPLLQSTRYRL